MKAIVYHTYGSPDVLKYVEIEKPAIGDNETLVRVRAASVNPLEWHLLRGSPYITRLMFGLMKPRNTRLGRDVAGEVEAVGKNVTEFKPGDAVFGLCTGGFAEYACVPESTLVLKADSLTFEQAASIPAAVTALQGLRDEGSLQPGQKVLINGASGGVGTVAVQLAKWLGASVTGVCSTKNVETVRALGADHVIDYTRENFTQNGQCYNLIFDCVGNHSLTECRRALIPRGTYVGISEHRGRWLGPMARGIKALMLSRFVQQKLLMFMTKRRKEDLVLLQDLMVKGKLTPVIDRRSGLHEIPAAIRYLAEGHARGKVIIAM